MAANDENNGLHTQAFQQVKDWIAHQEALEARHNQPVLLTQAELDALQVLKLPVSNLPAPSTELGNENYVGTLMEYRQRRPGGNIDFQEGGTATRWTCSVAISEASSLPSNPITSFPAEGYGMVAGAAPVFTTKKPAKQFAAKCALDWLRDHGFRGGATRPPPLASAPSFTTSVSTPPVSKSPSPSPLLKRPIGDASSPPPTKRQENTTTLDHDSPLQIVHKLCVKLNMPPLQYALEKIPCGDFDTWNGHPKFEDYGDQTVRKLMKDCAIQGVVGSKDVAKRMIALRLRRALEEIEAQREEQLEKLLKDTGFEN